MRPPMSLAVVGVGFDNKTGPTRLFELALCTPGEPVDLVPEPKNPADENAIAVFSCRGIQIGYIPSQRAPLIVSLMKRGADIVAIFQEKTEWGAAVRVTFDGSPPVLPAPHAVNEQPEQIEVAEEQDFWPDYIPPDD